MITPRKSTAPPFGGRSAFLCDSNTHGLSRRSLLASGATATILSTISKAFAEEDSDSREKKQSPKNVILLWLEGGPSQWETFDPHPGGRFGGEVKSITTTVPELMISELLPQTAEIMHHASLIRSLTSKEGDHERALYNIKAGYRPDPTLIHPSIGAVLCHEDHGIADIPRHISIISGNKSAVGGFLGAEHNAFKVGDPARPVPDIRSRVSTTRSTQRIDDLYSVVEEEFRRGRLQKLEMNRTLHETATNAALKMMSSDQLDAFDVTEESKTVRDAFGDTPFGRGCLAAVRLLEAGARCIEVTLGGWDSHVTNHRLQAAGCEALDPALASLINLLKERNLFDSTLVLCGGEFGRTPNINPAEGRDHWPHGFPMLLAGCGVAEGRVYGGTSPEPNLETRNSLDHVDKPVTIGDLHATIYTALGMTPDFEYQTPIGRPMKRSEGRAITEILA